MNQYHVKPSRPGSEPRAHAIVSAIKGSQRLGIWDGSKFVQRSAAKTTIQIRNVAHDSHADHRGKPVGDRRKLFPGAYHNDRVSCGGATIEGLS
jgi:hypothetical protein